MSPIQPLRAESPERVPAVSTTLLSLVVALTREGRDERAVCQCVVDLIEARRVVLTGAFRDRGIQREDMS